MIRHGQPRVKARKNSKFRKTAISAEPMVLIFVLNFNPKTLEKGKKFNAEIQNLLTSDNNGFHMISIHSFIVLRF